MADRSSRGGGRGCGGLGRIYADASGDPAELPLVGHHLTLKLPRQTVVDRRRLRRKLWLEKCEAAVARWLEQM
jgi:hypothetical protein